MGSHVQCQRCDGTYSTNERFWCSNFNEWHTDYTFNDAAGMYSFPHARIIPSKDGETKFVDLRPRGVAAAGGISVCPET